MAPEDEVTAFEPMFKTQRSVLITVPSKFTLLCFLRCIVSMMPKDKGQAKLALGDMRARVTIYSIGKVERQHHKNW